MILFDTEQMRETVGAVVCPTCSRRSRTGNYIHQAKVMFTLPLPSGACGFCDTIIAAPTATAAPGRDLTGYCAVCGDEFEIPVRAPRKKYCSTACRDRRFVLSEAGQESMKRKNDRKRERYARARAAGFNAYEATIRASRARAA